MYWFTIVCREDGFRIEGKPFKLRLEVRADDQVWGAWGGSAMVPLWADVEGRYFPEMPYHVSMMRDTERLRIEGLSAHEVDTLADTMPAVKHVFCVVSRDKDAGVVTLRRGNRLERFLYLRKDSDPPRDGCPLLAYCVLDYVGRTPITWEVQGVDTRIVFGQ